MINGKLFLDLGGIITICDVRDAAQRIAKAVDENVLSGCVEYIGIIGHNITITDLAHAMNCKEPYFSVFAFHWQFRWTMLKFLKCQIVRI